MSRNKEALKNKIIYRASYRGTKEMDMLMIGFVQSILNTIEVNELETLNEFVNMNDETLISIKKGESYNKITNPKMLEIIENFQKYNI
mgnify:CR=1 FL=1